MEDGLEPQIDNEISSEEASWMLFGFGLPALVGILCLLFL